MRLLDRWASHLRQPGHGPLGWLVVRAMILVNWRMNRWSVALLNIQPAEHVLEVGFGPGLSIRRAAEAAARVAGIDHSPAMLAEATRRNRAAIQAGRVDLRLGDVSALPFANDQFDKAFGVNVIYFWPDPVVALREIRRVLKPGGTLVLTVQIKHQLAKNPLTRPGIFKLYDDEELAALFTEAGFHAVRIEHGSVGYTASGVIGVK